MNIQEREKKAPIKNSRIFEKRIISLYELMVYCKFIFPLLGLSKEIVELESSLTESGIITSQANLSEEYEDISKRLNIIDTFSFFVGTKMKEVFPATHKEHRTAFKKAKEGIESGDVDIQALNKLKQRCYGLIKSFRDEANKNVFVIIDSVKAHYFTDEKPFGEAAYSTFKDFREDIGNASKCMAFDQHDAALYHAIGVMERCIRLLGKKTRIPDAKNKEWGGLIGEITTKNKGWNPSKAEHKEIRNKN